jgi:hypothetical protein
MADHREADSDDWGNETAKLTFWFTVAIAAGFVGVVFFYVLLR